MSKAIIWARWLLLSVLHWRVLRKQNLHAHIHNGLPAWYSECDCGSRIEMRVFDPYPDGSWTDRAEWSSGWYNISTGVLCPNCIARFRRAYGLVRAFN